MFEPFYKVMFPFFHTVNWEDFSPGFCLYAQDHVQYFDVHIYASLRPTRAITSVKVCQTQWVVRNGQWLLDMTFSNARGITSTNNAASPRCSEEKF